MAAGASRWRPWPYQAGDRQAFGSGKASSLSSAGSMRKTLGVIATVA